MVSCKGAEKTFKEEKPKELPKIEVVIKTCQYDSIAPTNGFLIQEIELRDTSRCKSYNYKLLLFKDSKGT